MSDLRSFQRPRYQATQYPGLGCTLDAITENGQCVTVAGVSTARNWNINQCREYAIESGFTDERTQRNETGQLEFHWYKR